MRLLTLAFYVAAIAFGLGCATDDATEDKRGGGDGDGNGAAGSTSNQDFGNSNATQPPPPAMDLMVTGDGCEAGHYVGSFKGMYLSPAAFEVFPVEIEAVDLIDPFGVEPPLPGFEFWLEASEEVVDCEPVPGEEFTFCPDFEVEGGVVRGQANALFPFEVELVGDLDCSAGVFRGILENGWYDALGVRYNFEGWMDSSYDAANAQFFDGTWAVTEPMSATGMAGGDGTWYAGWVMDTP